MLNEEFARAEAPLRADFFGDTLVGPTILQWATEEQKQQFIPGILKGTIAWCQGFSEPDAGSDLACLKTRAELDGDEWVINGQKVWTTQAQFADYIFLLARTDPDAPKHAGISYLLVPMHQPGIEVRPIAQVDGSADFNEIFFTNARCPKENVVGGVNNGWKVAMTTLGFERGSSATTGHRRFLRSSTRSSPTAQENGQGRRPADPPAPGPRLDQGQDHGDQRLPLADRRAQRHPPHGRPRAPATRCSGPSTTRQTMELAIDILGLDGQILTGDPADVVDERAASGAGTTTRSATSRRRSSSRAPRPSGAARPRSSATSWASGCSACPRSPRRPPPAEPPTARRPTRARTGSSAPARASSAPRPRPPVGAGRRRHRSRDLVPPHEQPGRQHGGHRADQQGHPGVGPLGDGPDQRGPDGRGAEEGHGVERHHPAPHGRVGASAAAWRWRWR